MHMFLGPTYRAGEVPKLAEAVACLQAKALECLWHNHALHPVIGSWHAIKALQALQGSCATLGLVGHHAAEQVGQGRAVSAMAVLLKAQLISSCLGLMP